MAKKTAGPEIPRELKLAGAPCLAFANTGFPRRDDRRGDSVGPPSMLLASYEELVTWCQRMRLLDAAAGDRLRQAATERPGDAAEALDHAVRLRAASMRIFNAFVVDGEPSADDLELVNATLQRRRVVPDAEGYHWDWGGGAEALDRALWPLAESAAELLASGRYLEVRQCATRGCRRMFLGTNKRRVWCDANTCGSRPKGKRYHDWVRRLERRSLAAPAAEPGELERYRESARERDREDRRAKES